jgi:hypothetical protein
VAGGSIAATFNTISAVILGMISPSSEVLSPSPPLRIAQHRVIAGMAEDRPPSAGAKSLELRSDF